MWFFPWFPHTSNSISSWFSYKVSPRSRTTCESNLRGRMCCLAQSLVWLDDIPDNLTEVPRLMVQWELDVSMEIRTSGWNFTFIVTLTSHYIIVTSPITVGILHPARRISPELYHPIHKHVSMTRFGLRCDWIWCYTNRILTMIVFAFAIPIRIGTLTAFGLVIQL
jgi:hypothetical protein